VSASVMMKGGDGLASVKTQYPATGDAQAFFTFTSPSISGMFKTVESDTDADVGTDPNYAVAYLSLAASSWNIHPTPF
jgi:hypothetical protein